MKTIANALVCASLLAGVAAHAEGLSVGGSLANSRFQSDGIAGAAVNDRTSTGGKIYGGYQFTPNFGLEAGYARLGKFGTDAGDVKGDGYYLDGVGTLPPACVAGSELCSIARRMASRSTRSSSTTRIRTRAVVIGSPRPAPAARTRPTTSSSASRP